MLFRKGPTFKPVNHREDKTLISGVNQVLEFSLCDVLLCTDSEKILDLKSENLKKLKYLIIPIHPHIGCIPRRNYSYKDVIKHIEKDFTGKLIPFNLRSVLWNGGKQSKDINGFGGHINKNFIDLKTVLSAGNSIVDFVTLLNNIKKVELYGIGILENTKRHNTIFKNTVNVVSRETIGKRTLISIRNQVIGSLKKKNIEFKFN